MRAAVVGHLEWVDFIRVDAMPRAGDIVHAEESWSEPGGGGPGAAVQLLKLAGSCDFFTAVGDDDVGRTAVHELSRIGLDVHAAVRPEATRRAITHLDRDGERTITVLGSRLAPQAGDPLPWDDLAEADCVYFTAGDAGALRRARRGRVLVATSRILRLLRTADVELDALVGSALDPAEAYAPGDLDPVPRLVVSTRGEAGGTFSARDGAPQAFASAPVPGPIVDRYGAGDSFAGGLTFALGRGLAPQAAVEFASVCGAAAVTGRGPYEGQATETSALERLGRSREDVGRSS